MIDKNKLYNKRLPKHLAVYTMLGLSIALFCAFLIIKRDCLTDKISKAYFEGDVKLIKTCARYGIVDAKVALGRGHIYGYSNKVSKDSKKALELCKPEAEKGNANAMFCMGLIYSNPGMYNIDQALSWKHKAAAQNHGEAMAHIGFHYLKNDSIEGKKWLDKSLPFVSNDYMKIIGDVYKKSYFIENNLSEAKIWYQHAFNAGNKTVEEYLKPNPAPFDLELTRATIADFEYRFPHHQFQFINAITQGKVYDVESKYIDLRETTDDKVRFIFDKNGVLEYVYITFNKNQFDTLKKVLNQKYKIFDSSGLAPFDRYAIYHAGMSIIDLQEPHLSFKMSLAYYTARFKEALNNYNEQQKNQETQEQKDSL